MSRTGKAFKRFKVSADKKFGGYLENLSGNKVKRVQDAVKKERIKIDAKKSKKRTGPGPSYKRINRLHQMENDASTSSNLARGLTGIGATGAVGTTAYTLRNKKANKDK